MYPHFRGSRLTKHTSLNPSCWSHCRNLEENASASKKRPNGQKVVCTLSLLRRASKVPPKTYGFKNTSSSRSLPLCWCCQAVAALVRPAERVWSTSVSRKPFFWVDIRFPYFPRDKINLAEKKSTKYWLMLHTKFQSVCVNMRWWNAASFTAQEVRFQRKARSRRNSQMVHRKMCESKLEKKKIKSPPTRIVINGGGVALGQLV